MELFNNLVFGFAVALTWQNLWFCFIGCFLGTLIGVLPGIGPLATIAMLLPITFNVPPVAALIMLPLATAIFGILMEEAGFIPAMAALIPLSAAAGRDFRWLEVALLTIGLTIGCAAGFIYGLGLPYPLIKGMWGY